MQSKEIKNDSIENLSKMFYHGIREFRDGINKLSSNGRTRVLTYSIEHPFENTVKLKPGIETTMGGLATHLKELMTIITIKTLAEREQETSNVIAPVKKKKASKKTKEKTNE